MPSVWAIGDIHGEAGMLNTLLNALPRAEGDYTVFIGDYIDRGEDSAGAVARVLAEYDRAPDHTILLWGNHEDMAASHFGVRGDSRGREPKHLRVEGQGVRPLGGHQR